MIGRRDGELALGSQAKPATTVTTLRPHRIRRYTGALFEFRLFH